MTGGTDVTCVFVGSFVDVSYYRERLEEIGVSSMVKDDFTAGIHGGFPGASGGSPDSVQLLVESHDVKKALQCIEALQKREDK